MLRTILIANRGEIAIRIMRACRELNIKTVAVYSETDKEALFTKYADEAYFLGPAQASASYLNVNKIIEVATNSGADAIHPGYGFLAQNANFVHACETAGIKFIGPSSKVISLMGNKVCARNEMMKAGIPIIDGTTEPVSDLSEAIENAEKIGYPVIVKPSCGGGGIGMNRVNNKAELEKALSASQRIANSAFGLAGVYIEKYLPHPRHIEIQILADAHGNVIHLGERECSIQRRYQKLIEEAPSAALTPELRSKMGKVAIQAAKHVGYEGAGTIEFLFYNNQFYFLEVNPRIQVEHAVTEMVTGIDIVKEQIHIASNSPIGIRQEDVHINGWAIECRINAEDPSNNFAPSPGTLRGYRSPGGIGIRVDSGVHTGYTIPTAYDSMISKLIAWGRDRNEAIIRMRRALYEYIILGVNTNIPFHKAVMENERFINGEMETHFIDRETTLLHDMQQIMQRDKPLADKLSSIFEEKRKNVAISDTASLCQGPDQMTVGELDPT